MANSLRSREAKPVAMKYGDELLYRISFIAVIGISVGVYWSSVSAPFIADDWNLIYSLVFRGQFHFIAQSLNPAAGGFFRPLGSLYLLVLYNVFKLDPMGYHVLGLALHAANSCLVVLVLERISGDRFVAWAAGMLYAGSALVHNDPLYWIVGAYDLLGAFFFLLSFYYFIEGKKKLSLLVYGLAALTKEATLVLPLILFAYEFLIAESSARPLGKRVVIACSPLKYYAAIMVAMALMMVVFVLPAVSASPDQAYGTSFAGATFVRNLLRYSKWCLEGILPLLIYPDLHDTVMIGLAAAAAAAHLWKMKTAWRRSAFLLCWFMVGLLPVLPLAQHTFRYYATYSLPAFFAFIVLPFHWVPESRRQWAAIAVSALILINVYAGTTLLLMLDERGAGIPAMEGTNSPARKAGGVKMVSDFFHSTYATVPESTLFVVDWFNTGPIGGNAAICVWYNDPSLRVAEMKQLERDSTGIYFDTRLTTNAQDIGMPAGQTKIYVTDPDRLIVLEYTDGTITPKKLTQ